jgi:hypothetical protein
MSAIVMCRVSGGITGTREAPLRRDGQVRYFETLAEAEAEVRRLCAAQRDDLYEAANFQYWAEEVR